jgi:ribosomal-protein-alanine N-acetyltransferase
MKIIPITRAHLPDVAELERICFSEPWSEHALELLLTDAAIGYVCEISGRAVAYVGMMLAYDEGQITNVAVHPDERRQGMGRALMDAVTQEARARGFVRIALEVRESNRAAIQLYERDGFVIAGKRSRFYRNPTEDAFVMIKAL